MSKVDSGLMVAKSELSLEPLDLLLSGASSVVAVFAAAQSLSSEKNAQFFLWIVLAGTLVSSIVLWFLGRSKFVYADTTAYTVAALAAAFGIGTLNTLTPEAIYVGPLTMAGVLSWMLALGSFTVWRDQTMLFQAVPAVALFGLVGCYDTFRASVIYFFVFLVCQAILLSRAHGRVMLRQARSSGADALEVAAMRRGPWRWMAGPEWALGSALAIVLISIIGAPILRESARGFSGLVRYTPPQSPLAQATTSAAAMAGKRIGTGPSALRDIAVLRAELPEPLYLRGFAFGRYERGNWYPRSLNNVAINPDAPAPWDLPVSEISDKKDISFKIELIVPGQTVPVPGEVQDVLGSSVNSFQRNLGGSYRVMVDPPYPPLEGRSVIFGGHGMIAAAQPEIAQLVPEYLDKAGVPRDVAEFASQVTKGAKTDYDKALAIKHAIENTAKYNILAEATPGDQDPVSYFLFTSREGYCDLFASSMTLMARSVGLPARYVTGYYPFTEAKDDEGRYIIREKDAHAWCEIFFKGAGWVVFDATEGAASVDGAGLGSSNDTPFWRSSWVILIVGFAGGVGVVYGAWFGLSAMSARRRSPDFANRHLIKAAARARAQVRKQYLNFEREIRRAAKRPRATGETILEYTMAAKAGLAHRAPLARDVGETMAAVLYSSTTPEPEALDRLREKISELKKSRRSHPA